MNGLLVCEGAMVCLCGPALLLMLPLGLSCVTWRMEACLGFTKGLSANTCRVAMASIACVAGPQNLEPVARQASCERRPFWVPKHSSL